ncbi:MAG TPA: helix-turn-helix domain-containing protein [Terriglobia bacterium]|nr:helix-turn-helix domain-containing protein [Terriglobia bacterium]
MQFRDAIVALVVKDAIQQHEVQNLVFPFGKMKQEHAEQTTKLRTAPGSARETAEGGSPLRNLPLVSTFTAARMLFPNGEIERKHLRLVQRLCERNEVESYKIGRHYKIVRQSVLDYIEESHGRTKGDTD